MFIQYVTEIKQRFGKMTTVLDRARRHHSGLQGRSSGATGTIDSPASRAGCHTCMIGKRRRLASRYYPVSIDIRKAGSEYFRTSKLELDTCTYLDG